MYKDTCPDCQGVIETLFKEGKWMGAPKPRDLYPTPMNLPELTPEKREEISHQARERMQTGTRLMSESLDSLSMATAMDDFRAMQEATARLREGSRVSTAGSPPSAR